MAQRHRSALHRWRRWLGVMVLPLVVALMLALVLALGPAGPAGADPAPVAGTALPLPEHTARYAVFRQGSEVGHLDIGLARHEDGSYHYTADTTATNVLLRVVGLALGEQGRFLWAGRIRPLGYQQMVRRPGRDKHWQARFDWEARRARGDSHRGPIDVAVPADVLDPLAVRLQLAVRLGAARLGEDGAPAPEYRFHVLERDEVEVQAFVARGRDAVPYGDGCLPATKLERLREGFGRGDFSWHAEAFHWMPVRILKVRDGEQKMDLRLRHTSLPLSPGPCPP